jgi:hypothetical protein
LTWEHPLMAQGDSSENSAPMWSTGFVSLLLSEWISNLLDPVMDFKDRSTGNWWPQPCLGKGLCRYNWSKDFKM